MNIESRIRVGRLIEKMSHNLEGCKALGLEDLSRFKGQLIRPEDKSIWRCETCKKN